MDKKAEYVADYSIHGDINQYLIDNIGNKFSAYRQEWEKARSMDVETNFPLYITIETIMRCNYKCTMCSYSDSKSLREYQYYGIMSDQLFNNIASEISEHSCPSVGMNNLNEPLLDKKIPERIEQLHKAGVIDIRMNTNGSLLDGETAERLIDSGLTRLMVGMDALTSETYAKIRVGGDFDAMRRNVETFLNLRARRNRKLPILRVTFVRLKVNEHETDNFIKYWLPIADQISIQEYRPPMFNETFRGIYASDKRISADFTCPQPWERLLVKGNGDIHPCCAQFHYLIGMGNMRDTTLHQAWNSDAMRRLRKHMKDRTWREIDICSTCITDLTRPT